MCPNIRFLIKFTDKLSVIFILSPVLTQHHTSLVSWQFFAATPNQFCFSFSLIIPCLLVATANLRSHWSTDLVLFQILYRYSFNLLSRKNTEEGAKKIWFCTEGCRNGVSLRERIRARPSRHRQKLLGESGPTRTHPCVISTVWMCLSCLTAERNKLLIF